MAKILIIDDEPEILTLTKIMLEREKYSVIVEPSGKEGLNRLEKELPDLILLDAMMPGEDGLEICKKIKANGKTKNIPVVMYTVKGSAEDHAKSKEAGAEAHINKPFRIDELISVVKKGLETGLRAKK